MRAAGKHSRAVTAVLAWALAWLSSGLAFANGKRLAVLEFRGPAGIEVLAALADEARAGALEAVRPLGYAVITRESMAIILAQMGAAEDCVEGECEVETARNIGADLVVTGEVTHIEGAWLVSLKLHETREGRLLATARVDDSAQLALVKKVRDAAESLVIRGLNLRPAQTPAPAEPDPVPASGPPVAVYFESNPPGAVVRVDGELACQATPCTRWLRPGRHQVVVERERYRPAHSTFVAERGARVSVKLEPTWAFLSVNSEPSGLRLSINGQPLGHTPMPPREIEAGRYQVTVEGPCHLPVTEQVHVNRGERRTLTLRAEARVATLRIDAVTRAGAPLGGEVYAAGRYVGPTGRELIVPLCTREVSVRAAGQTWTGKLSLAENATKAFKAVFDVPGWTPAGPLPGVVPGAAPQPSPPQRLERARSFPTTGVALLVSGLAAGVGGSIWSSSIRDRPAWQIQPGEQSMAAGLALGGWIAAGIGAWLILTH